MSRQGDFNELLAGWIDCHCRLLPRLAVLREDVRGTIEPMVGIKGAERCRAVWEAARTSS